VLACCAICGNDVCSSVIRLSLGVRIQMACNTITVRLATLSSDGRDAEERQGALNDALNALRVLETKR
jgi:hypothetical protein